MLSDTIPGVVAERFCVELSDGEATGWRWPRPGAPRIVFSHATGFCASAYRLMLSQLAAAFEVLALDLRGHGRSRLSADPALLRSWDVYAVDLAAVLDRLGGGDWILAGHSCGAVVSTLAARGRNDVAGLVLIEPVTMPPLYVLAAHTPLWPALARRMPLVKGALTRRADWPDRASVAESYARKRLFAGWAEGALGDYLEDGLAETGEGGVRLACEPAWEAATFAAHAYDFWGAVAAAPCPVSVLAVSHPTTTLIDRARRRLERRGARIRVVDGATHLLPLERPEAAAGFIADAARA